MQNSGASFYGVKVLSQKGSTFSLPLEETGISATSRTLQVTANTMQLDKQQNR